MFTRKQSEAAPPGAGPRFPGTPEALDGGSAVVAMETAAGEAAGAYPITPSTQMGEGWAAAVAAGATNVNGRRLLFFEPEGEHAAAAVTAGMSMVGLRAANFSSGQGIAYMHESLYAAVGKRLTYVLNVAARAITKHALNVHAGHDDYHCVDDTGFFQLFAKDVQEAADLNLIAHRLAELSLNPGIVAQDGFLTSHVIESVRLPERALIREYLGDPADQIDSPTPAQKLVFGERRRRIPELYDFDYPAMLGVVQNQDSYAQGVAAQRPFYFDHVAELAELAMAEFAALTGRRYERAIGYRLDDAEYVLAGQGSVVGSAEAVADWLREHWKVKVGVLNLTMFRPFPADLVAELLRGKKGVTVLERTDQPLAPDPPLLREMRVALAQAVENGRAKIAALPFPYRSLPAIRNHEVPDFFSAGFGFGSRDLQPGDLVAAVRNMLPGQPRQRQFYLGIDFIRKGTRLPKLQIWQEKILEAYPHLQTLALESAGEVDLLPEGTVALRMHSVGGWGAITTGKNLALTCFELLGLHVKANPKYGSEKKGQPTTFFATLGEKPVRLNAELKHVHVVLSPDPNVFRHSDPLAGLAEGGVFVIQTDQSPEALWTSLPATARRTIVERKVRLFALDGFRIASDEASDAELRYRMQGAAFMGAFFRVSPLAARHGLDEARLMEGIRAQMQKKFGKLGQTVVDDNLRVIRRGYDEVVEVRPVDLPDPTAAGAAAKPIPAAMDHASADAGPGNAGRFFEQVCSVYAAGQEPIADPFAALSAIPAATSAVRDMTGIRFEVPAFHADACTGCAQCWTQCPDTAIPGLVSTVEQLIDTAIRAGANGKPLDRVRQISRPLAKETRKVIGAGPFTGFGDAVRAAYETVAGKVAADAARRAELDVEFARVDAILRDFHVAKTAPFWDAPERREQGTGGLLAITVNPEACKGCNICVDVCPEGALQTVRQDEEIVAKLRRDWKFWEQLPDTDDRYVNVSDLEEGIGVLPSLLLKKGNYRTMAGGDGACMGCGEKTTVHLVVSAIEALMQPRVKRFVARLEELLAGLDAKARTLVSAEADLGALAAGGHADLALDEAQREEVRRITASIKQLKELRWRYLEGPGGTGRANLGISNSTGCSSVWASTYPFNPYPFPWVNHLFQDAPSVAIGIFEGHMRKMGDAFVAVRRAAKVLEGTYDAAADEAAWTAFDWKQFDDDEFNLCPPLLVVGGDGAMLDIGFQNLSRLMASGKPIRVMVLDTQVYSNTGGQASTGTYTGQSADMSPYGKAQHGKEEVRKELALIAIAHRGTYVLQSSQAAASHLMAGVLKGLHARRPALFNIYAPCPVEHGLPDEWAPHAARLALESRAFPLLVYDPDAGDSLADCLSLDGNPALDDRWPTYELEYVDEGGETKRMELPVTIADWAATEGRFKQHFRPLADDADDDGLVRFDALVALPPEEREGKRAFIHALGEGKRLTRLLVSAEMVRLADDRLRYWSQLRELAGLEVADSVRDSVGAALEAEFDARLAALRAEYEGKMAELKASYPAIVARKLAEGLLRDGNASRTVGEVLREAEAQPPAVPGPLSPVPSRFDTSTLAAVLPAAPPGPPSTPVAPPAAAPAVPVPEQVESAAAVAVADEDDDGLAMEPYIESDRCTTCNECTNLNGRMFAYNAEKQAYVKDPRAGTFAQLVQAAERCPAAIIHPGTPLNPKEKELEKWVKRAEKFA
ncbi:MAG: 2-oxoacid:acceptor oxidoreductase family protein [Longimicrobiaceae bacterium]